MTEREYLEEAIGNTPWNLREKGFNYSFYTYDNRFNTYEKDLLIFYNCENHNGIITEYKAINLEKNINDLNRYFLTFDLGTRLDGVLMDNFCVGIKGMSVEDCLIHLLSVYDLKFKECYVSLNRPKVLKLAKIIHNCYSERVYPKQIAKFQNYLKNRKIINIEEILNN